jgi:hypothetical protein
VASKYTSSILELEAQYTQIRMAQLLVRSAFSIAQGAGGQRMSHAAAPPW